MTRTGHIATLLLVLLALIGCSSTATDTLDQSAAALTLARAYRGELKKKQAQPTVRLPCSYGQMSAPASSLVTFRAAPTK